MEMDDQILFAKRLEEFKLKNKAKQELIIKKYKNKSIFITKEFYDKIYSKFKILTAKFKWEL